MNNPTLIIGLAIFTLVAVLAFAVYQRMRVSKAKDTHEHSAMTTNRPDQRDVGG